MATNFDGLLGSLHTNASLQDIYSSDCIPFADKGIPAINFMRFGAPNAAHIHDKYDTMHFISSESLNNTYSFVKVLWTQSGKYDASQITMICLGLSLSYVLTCLIMGF